MLDVLLGLLGSMVRINGLFHLLINGLYWGYNALILTIDPNFLGHPSGVFGGTEVARIAVFSSWRKTRGLNFNFG